MSKNEPVIDGASPDQINEMEASWSEDEVLVKKKLPLGVWGSIKKFHPVFKQIYILGYIRGRSNGDRTSETDNTSDNSGLGSKRDLQE